MTKIRDAKADDLPALTEIYNHYIVHSHATFLTEPQTPDERRPWFEAYDRERGHVLLVAEAADGTVQGYAGLGPYRCDQGFEGTVESTVYIAANAVGGGLGRSLYTALYARPEAGRFHRALSGIALPNEPSVALHLRFGFHQIGIFSEYAKKWDRYWSSLWMEKPL